jgi:glycosyltransferase involved in cell wall biosynthesis
MPRVSVIIDNYNYARFLPEAIDSVLAQDFPQEQIEIIVVDDGSTDNSREVLKSYGDRITPVFQENSGYAEAFNNGIGRAAGEFVCLLDADDVWQTDKIQRVVEAFEKNPDCPMVQHFLQDTDAQLKALPVEFPAWPEKVVVDDYLEGRFPFTATSGLSFRREQLLPILPLPQPLRFLYADDLLSAHMLFLGPAALIAEPLGLHRVHGKNFCAGGAYASPEKLADDFEMRQVFQDHINKLLVTHGKTFSAQVRRTEGLEMMRREILYDAHSGRRLRALGVWLTGFGRYGLSGFGLFRLATCLIAIASPALYLLLYQRYADGGRARGLRRTLLPA